MTEHENNRATKTSAQPSSEPRRRRRHGYRGYPNRMTGGEVHWGTGFSGIEPFGSGSNSLPRAGVLTEKTERATRVEPS